VCRIRTTRRRNRWRRRRKKGIKYNIVIRKNMTRKNAVCMIDGM